LLIALNSEAQKAIIPDFKKVTAFSSGENLTYQIRNGTVHLKLIDFENISNLLTIEESFNGDWVSFF